MKVLYLRVLGHPSSIREIDILLCGVLAMDEFSGIANYNTVVWDIEIDKSVRSDQDIVAYGYAADDSRVDAYLNVVADARHAMVSATTVADGRAFVHVHVLADDCTAIDSDAVGMDESESGADFSFWKNLYA